jgi:hypothetical protein
MRGERTEPKLSPPMRVTPAHAPDHKPQQGFIDIRAFGQRTARALNCKRWLLGILMLFAEGQKDSQNSSGAASSRCAAFLQFRASAGRFLLLMPQSSGINKGRKHHVRHQNTHPRRPAPIHKREGCRGVHEVGILNHQLRASRRIGDGRDRLGGPRRD